MQPWLAMLVCALASLELRAQVSWTLLSNGGPPARYEHSMAYDSHRGRIVMFGGYAGVTFGDTWEWDGTVWQSLSFVPGPPARYDHAMAFDSQRRRAVLFGGHNNSGLNFGDTWEWNGIVWTQMTNTGPSARFNHSTAFDSQRNRTVMLGGQGTGGYLADTWEWDGVAWVQVATTSPGARVRHAIAYDIQRGRTVLFGGYSSSTGYLADTWEWNGISWMQMATIGPSARDNHAMACDTFRGRTVLFGGYDGGSPLRDTWEWNGSTWLQVATTGPSARWDHAMAYDVAREQTVLFGGWSNLSDTWKWRGGLVATANAFGAGCGIPPLTLTPVTTPRINTTAQVNLTNVPASLAFMSLGWSATTLGSLPLPLSLAPHGMPGCDVLMSNDVMVGAAMTGSTSASYSLPLPNWAGLIGLVLYVQGSAYAPGANAGNTIVSNGVHWFIGNN